MKRRTLIHAFAALPVLPALSARAATAIHVYKNASCDCCTGWVKHLSTAGFAVQVTNTDDTIAIRKKVGIPDAFGACHTATVEGYAIGPRSCAGDSTPACPEAASDRLGRPKHAGRLSWHGVRRSQGPVQSLAH